MKTPFTVSGYFYVIHKDNGRFSRFLQEDYITIGKQPLDSGILVKHPFG